jgi:NAD(P)-dependent dehydrogenase (short-subunit alcohol dehydrogenase family)
VNVQRTYVVTGSASGIGRATKALLEAQGARVVGVDIRDAEIIADLTAASGRAQLVEDVRGALGDAVDAVIACAGVGGPGFAPETIIRLNYFGAVATLDGLRPLLARGDAPSAAVVASIGVLSEPDRILMNACLGGDEEAAVRCLDRGDAAYATTKRAVARWVRRNAVTTAWAGAGIALNAVAPAVIETPQSRHFWEEPEARARQEARQPFGGIGAPEDVASALAWLTGSANRFVTGQVVFVDGGFDCLRRGDDVW